MPRELGALRGHPGCEFGDERRDVATALIEPLLGGKPVERALGLEDEVDATHRLAGQRSCSGFTDTK